MVDASAFATIIPDRRSSPLRSPPREVCPPSAFATDGVGQVERAIAVCRERPVALRSSFAKSGPASAALTVGLADGPPVDSDPIESLALMRTIDGESRDIDRPAGVTFPFQISEDSIEPTIARRSRNLFSHDSSGPAGADEAKKVGP